MSSSPDNDAGIVPEQHSKTDPAKEEKLSKEFQDQLVLDGTCGSDATSNEKPEQEPNDICAAVDGPDSASQLEIDIIVFNIIYKSHTKSRNTCRPPDDYVKDPRPPASGGASVCLPTSTRGFSAIQHLYIEALKNTYPSSFYCIQNDMNNVFKDDPAFITARTSSAHHTVAAPCIIRTGSKGNKEFSVMFHELNDPTSAYINPPSDRCHKATDDDHLAAREGFEHFSCGKIVIQLGNLLHQFILVSYNAPLKNIKGSKSAQSDQASATIRLENLKKFFGRMCELANHHKMLVIIGGNFNFEVEKWRKEVETDKVKIAKAVCEQLSKSSVVVIEPDQPEPNSPSLADCPPRPATKISPVTKCEISTTSAIQFQLQTDEGPPQATAEHIVKIKKADLEKIPKDIQEPKSSQLTGAGPPHDLSFASIAHNAALVTIGFSH